MMQTTNYRKPAVAGLFYPDNSQFLREEIAGLLDQKESANLQGSIIALVLPHAGYQYSGATAASGFRLLTNKTFDAIIIVSPSHREYFDGISIYSGAGYETPMGQIPIHEKFRAALIENDSIITASDAGHHQEHAIEVQLPFLQHVIKGSFRIVPIVIGDQRKEYCFHLGKKLAEVFKNKNVLMIASTDLSHYHSYHEAEKLDRIIIEDIATLDFEALMDHLDTECTEACGGGPAVAVLLAASLLGADHATILKHCNSGDITGDRSRVVGYLSAVITKPN